MNIKILKAYMEMMKIYEGYIYSFDGLKAFDKYVKKYNLIIK